MAKSQKDPSEPGRIALLLVMLAIAGLWLQHHLGFEFQKFGVVSAIGLITGAATWLGGLVGEEKKTAAVFKNLLKPLRAIVLPLAHTASLTVIGILLVIALTSLSSVTVGSEAADETAQITLTPRDDTAHSRTDALDGAEPVRFAWVFTNPFGRSFELKVVGYLPAVVHLYPLISKQLILGRDVEPSPTVLFRPWADGMGELRDKGYFRLTRFGDSGARVLVQDTGHAAAFLVGPARPLGDGLMNVWGLELDVGQATPGARADLLLRWLKPHNLPQALGPTDCLLAEIVGATGVKAWAEVRLGGAPFTDVLMHDGATEQGGTPCASK